MMNNFTKFVQGAPLRNLVASTVAKALVETVILRYGAPLQILTEQGWNLEEYVLQKMCRLLEIGKVRTSSYHPRCIGVIERLHHTLNSMLGKIISVQQ